MHFLFTVLEWISDLLYQIVYFLFGIDLFVKLCNGTLFTPEYKIFPNANLLIAVGVFRISTDLLHYVLQEKDTETDTAPACSICLVNDVQLVNLPCSHAFLCFACGKKLTRCAICRAVIETQKKLKDVPNYIMSAHVKSD